MAELSNQGRNLRRLGAAAVLGTKWEHLHDQLRSSSPAADLPTLRARFSLAAYTSLMGRSCCLRTWRRALLPAPPTSRFWLPAAAPEYLTRRTELAAWAAAFDANARCFGACLSCTS